MEERVRWKVEAGCWVCVAEARLMVAMRDWKSVKRVERRGSHDSGGKKAFGGRRKGMYVEDQDMVVGGWKKKGVLPEVREYSRSRLVGDVSVQYKISIQDRRQRSGSGFIS